eukprot:CAMPEP_0182819930 /NCGR_PEP_ID=MMETSP0006_2-20121128/12851_1 /TAXON_ID=97485 /ORGANISM="Prymnesium parvum, Strain Texoma1" /LENGTH=76 /DNA_ID=CAMNT_0024946557 /DNA_START=444 /DNA_END=674 /DNA_ORIENTATION=-
MSLMSVSPSVVLCAGMLGADASWLKPATGTDEAGTEVPEGLLKSMSGATSPGGGWSGSGNTMGGPTMAKHFCLEGR